LTLFPVAKTQVVVALHRCNATWNLCTITKNRSPVAFHRLNGAFRR